MLTSFFPFPIFVCVNSMQQKLGQNQHEFEALFSFTKRWQRKRESPNLSYKAPEKQELLWVSTVTWQKFWKRTKLQLEGLSAVGFGVRGFDCILSKWYFSKKSYSHRHQGQVISTYGQKAASEYMNTHLYYNYVKKSGSPAPCQAQSSRYCNILRMYHSGNKTREKLLSHRLPHYKYSI